MKSRTRRELLLEAGRGFGGIALASMLPSSLVAGPNNPLAAKPPPATFDLQAPTSFPTGIGSTNLQFAVTEPTVVGALDSERIVVRPMPMAITYLGKAQWSDRVPKLVQARLIDAFQNTGRVRSVGSRGTAPPIPPR